MTEEFVTLKIMSHLQQTGWTIVCYDFPQSGTGIMLHPDGDEVSKNEGAIIPDIVAVKAGVCLFFENKNRFYKKDYEKCNNLKINNNYKTSISSLISGYQINAIYYGIGMPTQSHTRMAQKMARLVDFVVGVNSDASVNLLVNNIDSFLL